MAGKTQTKDVELAEERRAAERRERNAMDELLIANARKSPEQIEEATGIPANQAMERLAMILRSRDWMTDRMEERLLLIEMGDLIDGVKKRLQHVDTQYYADTANVALRGYEAISKRMDARKMVTEEEMSEYTRIQAETYIETLNEAVADTLVYIAEVYPDMDVDLETAVMTGFQRALPKAYEKIRARIRD
jgi:hypothetical protein